MTIEPIIFLDIDGVLNDHSKKPNGYSGIMEPFSSHFNTILRMVPDAKVVIHSAWRYLIHSGSMNMKGMENLFLTHGLDIYGKLHGYTESDEEVAKEIGAREADFDDWKNWVKEHGIKIRKKQIEKYLDKYSISCYAILDDINLQMENQIHTVDEYGNFGLNNKMAYKTVKLLQTRG